MTNDLGERRDLANERDSEEWWAMYDTVQAEKEAAGTCDAPRTIMAEVDRRLKAKYESACGKD